jgi:hypothetical protein
MLGTLTDEGIWSYDHFNQSPGGGACQSYNNIKGSLYNYAEIIGATGKVFVNIDQLYDKGCAGRPLGTALFPLPAGRNVHDIGNPARKATALPLVGDVIYNVYVLGPTTSADNCDSVKGCFGARKLSMINQASPYSHPSFVTSLIPRSGDTGGPGESGSGVFTNENGDIRLVGTIQGGSDPGDIIVWSPVSLGS